MNIWATPRELLLGVVTFALALLLAFLLIILAQSEPVPPFEPAYQERILELDREAVERAYVEHTKKLFSVWVTDYSDEPPKALKGAQQARSAYTRAMNAIEKREKELQIPLPPRRQ